MLAPCAARAPRPFGPRDLALRILAIGLTAALASACSKPGQGAASASTSATPAAATGPAAAPNLACAALTAAAASDALHTAVTLVADTPPNADAGQSRCTYTYASGGAVRAYVTVGAGAKGDFDQMKGGATGPTSLSGVGDQAFTSEQAVGAIQSDHFVSVIGGGQSTEQQVAKAMLAALAR